MSQSATLPTCEHSTREKHVPEETAHLLTPSLEDQHVAQQVDCVLRATDYWALHAVRVSVRSRVVFLEGRVRSYYLKQLAQETARGVPGTHQICNDLDVMQTEWK